MYKQKNASHDLSIVKRLGEDWRCKGRHKICYDQTFSSENAVLDAIFNECWRNLG